jgi:hypothetical protein
MADRLLVLTDADTHTVEARALQLAGAARAMDLPDRDPSEGVAILIPKRNIETWIAYLNGSTVDETTEYPRLTRPRDCGNAVRALLAMCKRQELREPTPLSLKAACGEYPRLQGI